MTNIDIIIFLMIFTLVCIQTIVGVGVLVIGTPILLILDYNIIDAISILLPISIVTSLANIFYINFKYKMKAFPINHKITKFFFVICVPSVFIGIIILKLFQNLINFKILVSIIILTSLFIKIFLIKNLIFFSKLKKKIYLILIGIIHGLTNSGGSLLSLFLLNLNNNEKNKTRYDLSFFYFFLALLQYILFVIVFNKDNFNFNFKFIDFGTAIILGIFAGNLISLIIKEKYYRYLVETIVLISVIVLLIF
jgi:uncharacterized membrane protein YfcA